MSTKQPAPAWLQRAATVAIRVAIAGTTVELIGILLLFAVIAIGVWAVKTGH
jgi:hypothetical protein